MLVCCGDSNFPFETVLFSLPEAFVGSIVTKLLHKLYPITPGHLAGAVANPTMEVLYKVRNSNALKRYLV